jgi:copper resistance protein D
LFDPLIWTRLIHFTATIAVTGAIFFLALVAEPAFREAKAANSMLAELRRRLAAISWIGLAVAILSGAAWLGLLAARMADLPYAEALSEGTVWTVLSDTDFGTAWTVRLVIAGLLTASLPWLAVSNPVLARQRASVAVALAAALSGSLAWAGHAAAGAGVEGGLHLVADVLHLIAGAAWVGALVPLAVLLRAGLGQLDQAGLIVATRAVLRFSMLGIASVGALFISGIVNTWILVGSIAALFGTQYGRLLLVKIAIFVIMLLFAAANRFWLTPRIVIPSDTASINAAMRRVRRNTLIEAALGVIVIFIVSILGTMSPSLEAVD